MTSQPGCQACAFVSRQLGPETPCFRHVGRVRPVVFVADEAYAFGAPRPTLAQPGVFTVREYARLLVLRSRIEAQRWAEPRTRPRRTRVTRPASLD